MPLIVFPKQLRSFSRKRVSTSLLMLMVLVALLTQTSPSMAQPFEASQAYNRGIDYFNKGETAMAIDLFTQASRIDPTYVDAYYNLGTVYFQQKDYTKAIQAFEQAQRLRPSDNEILYNLSLCYERQGQFQKAAPWLKKIAPGQPRYNQAQAKLQEFNQYSGRKTTPKQTATHPAKTEENYSAKGYQATGNHAKLPPIIPTGQLAVETVANGFNGPTGIASGFDGALFVANYTKNTIERIAADGRRETFAQGGGLNGPVGLVFNPNGFEFYVANYLGNTISRVSPGGKVTTVASGLKKPYYLYLDSKSDTLFVSEQESNSVAKIKISP